MVRYDHTNKSDGQTLSAAEWNAIGNALEQDSVVPGYFVASNDAPTWMKNVAHYVCDGTADDVQIQAAIDLAQADVDASLYTAPTVYFSPGRFFISATIEGGSAFLVGAGANLGTRFVWSGTAGGTMYQETANTAGRFSIGRIEGINWTGATPDWPGTHLDLTDHQIDSQFYIIDCHFNSCTSDSIMVGNVTNLHWEHLRWDGVRGYAVRYTPPGTQNNSNFVIRDFTYDHTHDGPSGAATGFLIVDNTGQTPSNLGNLKLQNARVEVNLQWAAPQAFITMKHDAVTNSRTMHYILENIQYDDVISADGGMSSDRLFYRDTTNTTGGDAFSLIDVNVNGLSAITGGTWPASMPTIPLLSYYHHLIWTAGTADGVVSTGFAAIVAAASANWLRLRRGTEANDRLAASDTGQLAWGSGSASADVTLERTAAGTIGVGAGHAIKTGRAVTGSRPSASTVGEGAMFYDTTLDKPIWSDGTNWKDATGTTV
jgi:Pectate lyase superfamily protein